MLTNLFWRMVRAASKRQRRMFARPSNVRDAVFADHPRLHQLEPRQLMSAEMDVLGNLLSIASGDATPSLNDHTHFNTAHLTGGTVTRTFTIKNLGDTQLNLVGSPVVEIIGTNASDFTVVLQPGAAVDPAGSVTFDVTFDPSAIGSRTATVRIANDDSDESLYEFAISGTGTNAEVDIQGNSTSIADDDVTPAVTDFTDFRQVPVSSTATSSVTRTFTIRNTGTTDLTLTGSPRVTISGAHAADFTVTTQPSTATIAASGSTTFIITFNPSAAGLRTATVTVATDDADESTYNFDIQGTGIETTTAGSGLQIATLVEGTGTGAAVGDGLSVRYTGYLTTGVQFDSNVGGNLFNFVLGGGTVIQGWDQGLVGLKYGEKRTLVIPSALGYGSAGSGANIPPNAVLIFEVERIAPEISVGSPQATVIPIDDGDTTPSTADHTDFGSVTLGDGVVQWTFRITTTGALNLTGNPRVAISGADASAFTVVAQPTTPLMPGSGQSTATRDFAITFNPTKLGAHNATVSIANDDSDENPYNFSITGTGIAQRLEGAVEDIDFVVTHEMLNDAMKETGTSGYRVESVQAGQLFKNGVLVEPGVTLITAGQSLTWRPPANANHTQAAFTVIAHNGSATVGNAEAIRVEITAIDDAPTGAIDDITLTNGADQVISLASLFNDADITGTIARILTSLGAIDVHLFDGVAPLNVANFLNYANGGDWVNTIIHRVAKDVLAQGGAFKPVVPFSHIAVDPAVVNEFNYSNQRGTISMAKTNNQPDSATSEWFFNIGDNADTFDNLNGGSTVIGEVLGNGMSIVDIMNNTPVFTDGGANTQVPLIDFTGTLVDSNWIKVLSVSTISNLSFSIVGNTNPDLVTASLDGGSLELDMPQGVAGSSDITIRATDLTGETVDVTFTVNVVGVGVVAIDNEAAEPTQTDPADLGKFRITRGGPTTEPLTINYTITGTAANGIDYLEIELQAIIPAGESFIDIDILPLIDESNEGIESVVLTLGSGEYVITEESEATLSIFDDRPIVSVVATDAAAAETNTGQPANTGLYTITRTGSTAEALTVNFTITGTAGNGTDYSQITQSVIIPIGQSSVTVSVNPANDALNEFDETAILTLSSNDFYVVGEDNDATVTITDNEAVLLGIEAIDNLLTEVPTNGGTFRITRTGPTTSALVVKFTRGGTATFGPAGDYTFSVDGVNLTTTTVTIPAGSSFVDVNVNVIDDTKPDINESVTMTLATGTGYVLPVVASRVASMTIVDDEPVVSITSVGFTGADAQAAETNEGETANRGVFRISRTGSLGSAMVVKFAKAGTAGTSEYTLVAGGIEIGTSVTIPAGVDHIDVFVNPTNDTLVEVDETVILTLAANTPYSLDPDLADQSASVTIADNEPFVSVASLGFNGADNLAGEGGNIGRFRISRTAAGPAISVNIKITGTAKRGVKATHDYFITVNGVLVTSNTIVIPNNATFIDVIVNTIDDITPEGGLDETVILTLGNATKNYKLDPDAADRTATVHIDDNEPVVSITALDAVAGEPGGSANTGKFRISRTGPLNQNLEVTYKITGTATGGTDYVKLLTKIIIPAGLTFVDIELQPLADSLGEATETVTLSLVAQTKVYGLEQTAASATVQISDGTTDPGPDLVILSMSQSPKTFFLSKNNSNMSVSAVVRNQGNASTGVSSQVRVLLSADRTASGDDIEMGILNLGVLAPGASATVSGGMNIFGLGLVSPDDIGAYYIILVADVNNAVNEAIETNNNFASFAPNVLVLL